MYLAQVVEMMTPIVSRRRSGRISMMVERHGLGGETTSEEEGDRGCCPRKEAEVGSVSGEVHESRVQWPVAASVSSAASKLVQREFR